MALATTIRRRRGVVRASVTRLSTRLLELESKADQPATLDLAQQMSRRLESLDSDFRTQHYALIDLIEEGDDDTMRKEQAILDGHDDETADLASRIRRLITACDSSSESGSRKIALRRLTHLGKSLASVRTAVDSCTGGPDTTCLLRQYDEQLRDLKTELGDICNTILALAVDDSDELYVSQARLDKELFDCSLKIKELLSPTVTSHASPSVHDTGVRLPKLDAPKFDGSIVNWRTFWEQFSISIHDRPGLSDAEKLAYLRHSLKDGSARNIIEGLSRSGDCYTEAIDSLKARYDRPRLIHQTHVRMILEATPLKDGTGKELRRLHDVVQQHLRALKAMDYEPSGPFITSVLELKLDTNTMFEWQKHSQDSPEVPHYQKLLEFINLRAQASEVSVSDHKKTPRSDNQLAKKNFSPGKPIASFPAHASESPSSTCIICQLNRHPLYACPKFKSLPHDEMVATLKSHRLCFNCLRPGHFVKECTSLHRCRKCQKPHHTLLHLDPKDDESSDTGTTNTTQSVVSHTAAGLSFKSLLMTCRVLVEAPDGSSVEARAILDPASSASFVSERLAQSLFLPRSRQGVQISGIAGLSHNSPLQSVASLTISSVHSPSKKFKVIAVVMPRVTCDLPLHPVSFDLQWRHLEGIPLADPNFGLPGRVDILLGVDVFVEALRQGRRTGMPGSPSAFETDFGWVLAGKLDVCSPDHSIASHHVSVVTGDDLLRRFWEIESCPEDQSRLTPEERSVVQQFKDHHSRTDDGRFVVPLPKKPHAKPLGESRSRAVHRFLALERSLHSNGQVNEFNDVINEYFEKDHAELVPLKDLEKPVQEVFYLPVHVVRKESSTTSKVRAVFDASAKSSNGVSLNDTLLVGPTVHPPLIDVLLRFRLHRVALITDVSRMYRAVLLTESDKDLHRFVWRRSPKDPLLDYRMTRITFGISASSFAANMSVKQNAIDLACEYPLAVKAVNTAFYVDDGLTGADSTKEAIELQQQLQGLFSRGGFLLRKWNSDNQMVLQHIPPELRDSQSMYTVPDSHAEYVKTLGLEWNANLDCFRLTIAGLPPRGPITKRLLASDVAKTFDVLGWFSPSIIKVKILLQQLWKLKIGWDDLVPDPVCDVWSRWRSELDLLATKHIPRCYFFKEAHIVSMELHGFCDASEQAYAAVIYLRMTDVDGKIQISLVTSKTKVAPIKRLTIPRLELCGAYLLAQLLHHTKQVFDLPLTQVYAWTDSTIVLSWLVGNPRRFNIYVANRVSYIVELIAPDRWSHVRGSENPADCASRGLFPVELLEHQLWWNGPNWLTQPHTNWPHQSEPAQVDDATEERECTLHTMIREKASIIPIDRYSSYTKLKCVTARVLRFVNNCRSKKDGRPTQSSPFLTTQELHAAETYWVSIAQEDYFEKEIQAIKKGKVLPKSSPLFSLHPIIDSSGVIRVGGRGCNQKVPYSSQHPVIISGKHPLARLIIHFEHLRLLHAGPTLLACSLNSRFYIIGGRKAIRSITRGCITCRRVSARPQAQMLGQLPIERITPDLVFDKVGVDYAGPFYIKYGHVRKPTIVKSYASVFVSLSVKAVHIELASDLTAEAFIACLRRFISRRGKPALIWSDHGTNFVGAAREIKEIVAFLDDQKSQDAISQFCSVQGIQWKFIPEHSPHFGGLWEAAVKSMKKHLKHAVGSMKLTFEELTTILTQVEACLNSRPLVSLPSDDDGIGALTPGHFLIGRPLEALPDPSFSYRSLTLLRRWHLCQALVRLFWQRWSTEYLTSLKRYTKWHHPSRNLRVGDIVVLQEDNLVPTKWPLAKVIQVHTGKDNLVRVATVKTAIGTYKRPVTKIALLLPSSD